MTAAVPTPLEFVAELADTPLKFDRGADVWFCFRCPAWHEQCLDFPHTLDCPILRAQQVRDAARGAAHRPGRCDFCLAERDSVITIRLSQDVAKGFCGCTRNVCGICTMAAGDPSAPNLPMPSHTCPPAPAPVSPGVGPLVGDEGHPTPAKVGETWGFYEQSGSRKREFTFIGEGYACVSGRFDKRCPGGGHATLTTEVSGRNGYCPHVVAQCWTRFSPAADASRALRPARALLEFAQGFASEPCTYGDNCPKFSDGVAPRHGCCNNCHARRAIERDRAGRGT